jgi:hypothetical protein
MKTICVKKMCPNKNLVGWSTYAILPIRNMTLQNQYIDFPYNHIYIESVLLEK